MCMFSTWCSRPGGAACGQWCSTEEVHHPLLTQMATCCAIRLAGAPQAACACRLQVGAAQRGPASHLAVDCSVPPVAIMNTAISIFMWTASHSYHGRSRIGMFGSSELTMAIK